jgi:hypothetical protein
MRQIVLPLLFALAALACDGPPASPVRRPPAQLSFGMDTPPSPPPLVTDPPMAKATPTTSASAPAAAPETPKPLPILKAKKASEATMMIYVAPPKDLIDAFERMSADPKSPSWIKVARKQLDIQSSGGSGFAVAAETSSGSWIATNEHVADGGWTYLARLPERAQPFTLEAAFMDNDNDIAILKSADPIPGLTIAEKKADIRTAVYSVGFPGIDGRLGYKESRGEITNSCYALPCFVLHDAPLSPGNSGGPLIEVETQLAVGINTASHRLMKNTYIATQAIYVPPAIKAAKDAQAAIAAKKAPPGAEKACNDLVATVASLVRNRKPDAGEHVVRIHPRLIAATMEIFREDASMDKLVPELKKDVLGTMLATTLPKTIFGIAPGGVILNQDGCGKEPVVTFPDANEPTAVFALTDSKGQPVKATLKWSHGAWRLLSHSR